MHIATSTILRLAAAAALGGLVGLERTLHHKPAGLRTHTLIAMGSALFTILSFEVGRESHDPEHIMTQIISGIGFIGGGVILRSGMTVIGLTTAASIFVVAAIGMAVGAGYFWIGAVSTLFILAILSTLGKLEHRITQTHQVHQYTIGTSKLAEASRSVNNVLDELKMKSEESGWERAGNEHVLQFNVHASPENNHRLMRRLLELK